jgi:RNA polymerase sigma factor (sigma-70 family)
MDADMNDDDLADIHIRIIAGDPNALSDFEARMRPRILGLLRRIKLPEEDADEVWNDAFLAAIVRAPSIEPVGAGLRSFVLEVAHNKAVDRIRRAVAHPVSPLDPAEADPPAGRMASDTRKEGRIRDCIQAARPAYADVMEMTSRGMTANEIAAVLGKSEASVAKLRSRARAWFANCLKGILDE